MSPASFTPEQDLHFVLCEFGPSGQAYVETDPCGADASTIVRNLVGDESLEVTIRSPRGWNAGEVSVAYSLQHADGKGAVTGGLTNFSPPASGGYFPLDHDQRHTLSVSLRANLPARGYFS